VLPKLRASLSIAIALTFCVVWPSIGAAQFRYPPVPYGYRFAGPESELRIEGTPKDAEVYVDGYYAGVVDDFDGVFQRLHVLPGEHEISIYLEGYRTHSEKLYLSPRSTRTIEVTLEKLGAGESPAQRPEPAAGPGAPPLPRDPAMRGPMPRRGRGGFAPPPGAARAGTLAIQVRPADAEILIDGERWAAPAGEDRFPVQLNEGPHRIEVRKDGYRPFVTDIFLRGGENAPLNVSLTPE